MKSTINLTKVQPKEIYPLSGFQGARPDGQTLSFTNYYMEIDGQPFFAVAGEIHYARLWEGYWEDALVKMKMGGVNIISTYIFWIHHEEEEGVFDFSGRRNLRKFIELCAKHNLYVIVRLGPFDHGEARNGGLPDWLYGKPCEVRSLDEAFLAYTKRLYTRLGEELAGLLCRDGGPVIAA
jgi:beta-galactosidase GanA